MLAVMLFNCTTTLVTILLFVVYAYTHTMHFLNDYHARTLNIRNTIYKLVIITRCAYAQGRVKRLSSSICLFVCLSSKNTAVCCLTARKSPRNSSLPLGLAIYILRKMPRKPDESSVECYGHGFLIAARPRGV